MRNKDTVPAGSGEEGPQQSRAHRLRQWTRRPSARIALAALAQHHGGHDLAPSARHAIPPR